MYTRTNADISTCTRKRTYPYMHLQEYTYTQYTNIPIYAETDKNLP